MEKWVIKFNEQSKVNNVKSNCQIYKRDIQNTFSFDFFLVDKREFFNGLKKLTKDVQKESDLWSFYLSNFYPQGFQIVTCIIW